VYIPPYETLETARAFHLFAERGSLYFLMTVVGLELAELYLEHATWEWGWSPYGKKKTLLSPQSLIKFAGVVFFGIAMALEYASIEFSESVDRLSDEIAIYEQRQTRAALVIAGKANREAAQLRKDAEDEANARLKLQQRMGGWQLSTDEQNELVDKLKSFLGTPFDLVSDPVEAQFMNQIDDVLARRSGWNRLPPRQPDGTPYIILIGNKAGVYVGTPGINIEVARDAFDRLGNAFSGLKKALSSVGIVPNTNIVRKGEGDPRAIHIIIGKR
jgi:hypothetical protein